MKPHKELKQGLCLVDDGRVRERKMQEILNTRVWCYDNLSQTAVSNVQTISAIHGFLYSLINMERFLRPEAEVSVSSQLALSVQWHSTFDRPAPPWDPHCDNAARHTSGALLQRMKKKKTFKNKIKKNKQNTNTHLHWTLTRHKCEQTLARILADVVNVEPC